MVEKVRCQTCRRFFDPSEEDGWFLQLSANVVDGDPDGDFLCSSSCLMKHGHEQWMDMVDEKIKGFMAGLAEGRDGGTTDEG